MKTTLDSFRKRVFCPSSETILEYAEQSLSASSRKRIRRHMDICDFCGAELFFLSRHRLADEVSLAFPKSSPVRVIVKNVLLDGSSHSNAQRAA